MLLPGSGPHYPELLSVWPSPQTTEPRGHSERHRSPWWKASQQLQFAEMLFHQPPLPLLGLFKDSFSLSPGGFDPLFLQAFLLSAVPSFLHNCCIWTLAFHFIFIWLLPQLPIFECFAYYQSGPFCTLLSSILLIGLSMDPAFPKGESLPSHTSTATHLPRLPEQRQHLLSKRCWCPWTGRV